MPHLTQPIASAGPLIEVAVGVSKPRAEALKAAGKGVPLPVLVRALIDTGASCSTIDPSIVVELHLAPTGSTLVHTPTTDGTPRAMKTYDVSVVLIHSPNGYVLDTSVAVIESAQRHHGYSVLLGRDVLGNCLLVYDGKAQNFSLAF